MASGEPARATYETRRRSLDAIVVGVLLAATALIAWQLLAAKSSRRAEQQPGADLATGQWPSQGQAALVLGDGRPAASPGQQPAPIASLAKVMTAYLTLERQPLEGDEEGFTVTVTAVEARAVAAEEEEGQSVVPVEAGQRLSERELLEALLIPSGNNIARLLAARLAGDESSFVAEMNAAAGEMGMEQTTYTDPSGFDPGTVSTAADQLRVFRRAMGFEAFRQIVSMGSVTLPVAGTLENFDPLLAEGFAGKTGSDSAAGGCLAFFTDVTVHGRPRTAVGVVMGQGGGSDTANLLAAAGEAAEDLVGSAAAPPDRAPPPLTAAGR